MKKILKQIKFLKAFALISGLSISSSSFSQNDFLRGPNPCLTPVFTDNFSNASVWTVVDPELNGNGSIQINSTTQELMYSHLEPSGTACASVLNVSGPQGSCNGREMRVYRSLGTTLSNNTWRAECKISISGGNGPAHCFMGYTAGNNEPQGSWSSVQSWSCAGANSGSLPFTPTNQDGIFASLIAYGNEQFPGSYTDRPFSTSTTIPNSEGWRIFGHAKKATGNIYTSSTSNPKTAVLNSSAGILLPALNTNYWIRLERINPGRCQISVFSDIGMSTHIPGSPQCFDIDPTIQQLNTIQNFTYRSGTPFRSLAGTVDNIQVWNGCPAVPPVTLTASSTTVCPGSSVTLTATPGFSGYDWAAPISQGTLVNTYVVTPAVTTAYTVFAYWPGINCPIPATVTVTISNPYTYYNPDFSLSGVLPAGNPNYFTAQATPVVSNQTLSNAGSNYSYSWKVEQLDLSPSMNVLATVNNPVNWQNNFSVNNFPGLSGTPLIAVNTSIPETSTGSNKGAFPLSPYQYRIIRYISNPCTTVSMAKIIKLCTGCKNANSNGLLVLEDPLFSSNVSLSVWDKKETDKVAISISPNPTSGIFTVSLGAEEKEDGSIVSKQEVTTNVSIFNSIGSVVYSKPDVSSSTAELSVNLQDQPKGVYFVRVVKSNGQIKTTKIILE